MQQLPPSKVGQWQAEARLVLVAEALRIIFLPLFGSQGSHCRIGHRIGAWLHCSGRALGQGKRCIWRGVDGAAPWGAVGKGNSGTTSHQKEAERLKPAIAAALRNPVVPSVEALRAGKVWPTHRGGAGWALFP